jgi:hypothetical protein
MASSATARTHAHARTNSQGVAVLKFLLPDANPDNENSFAPEIKGKKGTFENSVTGELAFWRLASILLTSTLAPNFFSYR